MKSYSVEMLPIKPLLLLKSVFLFKIFAFFKKKEVLFKDEMGMKMF